MLNLPEKKGINKASVTIGLILIALGVSIILSYVYKISYWSAVPAIVLLIVGIWGLFTGLSSSKQKSNVFYFGPSPSSYIIGWSSVIIIAGALFSIHILLPEISSIIYLGLFIILVGLITLIISVSKTNEGDLS